ncbi:MAG: Soluble lytic murein transglycosylase [Alphaproteobacteria bacterium MarineAlpha9_Bin4]|nr:MAG: Soluble lytic murein transglycosylase [Alphaproteobacteria bacterium MarineAlpha9_Bin4]
MKICNYIILFFLILIKSNSVFANKLAKLENNNLNFIIPNILTELDKKLYLEINELMINGKWEEAKKKTKLLKNKVLLGYIDYDKLMHPNKYRSSYNELFDWLETYNDYPVVMQRRVYNLMRKRTEQNKQKSSIKKPVYGRYLRGYGENNKRYANEIVKKKRNNKIYINDNISNLIISQEFKKLLKYYNFQDKSKIEIIYYLQKDAEKNFHAGFLTKSFKTYKFLINEIKIENPKIIFKAGINAFRLKNYNASAKLFEKCNFLIKKSANEYSPKLKSACLYWQAKISSKQEIKNSLYLQASKFNRTMYGQLAIEKLNKKDGFVWDRQSKKRLKNNKKISITNLTSFHRLIALSELKFYDKADLEMRNLYSKIERNKSNSKLLLHLSEYLDLAAVQIRLGESFFNKDYSLFMRGMYPTPEWSLEEGFIFDKAFIYAIIRRESAFNFRAKSSKGARGLMQLMPRTASKIQKDHRLRYGNKHKLYSLNLNLELGQKLLKELLKNPTTKNSILNTLIAYNAGITRVKKWNKNIRESDPLAFVESIPIKETRMFVKYILTDLWIYRDKLGQNKITRSMLANDKWPILSYQDFNFARDAKLR